MGDDLDCPNCEAWEIIHGLEGEIFQKDNDILSLQLIITETYAYIKKYSPVVAITDAYEDTLFKILKPGVLFENLEEVENN